MIKIITNFGSSMIARSIAGEKLTFTSLKIGTGAVAVEENPYDFANLKLEVKTTEINSFEIIQENIVQVEAIYSNEGFLTTQAITEYGIYAKIGDEAEKLYCYMYRPELVDNIPAFSTDTFTKRIKRFKLEIGTADGVTISVDNSIAFVTREELNNVLSSKADLSELQKIKDYLRLESIENALGYSYLGEFYLG